VGGVGVASGVRCRRGQDGGVSLDRDRRTREAGLRLDRLQAAGELERAPSGQSWTAARTGQQFNNVAVSVPADGTVYNLSLQLCNEQTCGTPSQVRTLQTYGPVGVGNLGTTDTATRVECRWPVNPNGLRTAVYIGGSNRGTIGPGEGTHRDRLAGDHPLRLEDDLDADVGRDRSHPGHRDRRPAGASPDRQGRPGRAAALERAVSVR
jgi:hypothetical protein